MRGSPNTRQWAASDEFEPLRVLYLRSLAVVELLADDVLTTVAANGVSSVPTRRFETLLSALRNERDTLSELGLTPTTRAAMAQTVASTEATLHDLAARGRQINERRDAELALIESHDSPDEDGDGVA